MTDVLSALILSTIILMAVLAEAAGIRWETLITVAASVLTTLGAIALKNWRVAKQRREKFQRAFESRDDQEAARIAELDLAERKRVDGQREQFIEMFRQAHAQQLQNMQTLIANQEATMKSQTETLRLQGIELEKRGIQISEMQNQILTNAINQTSLPRE